MSSNWLKLFDSPRWIQAIPILVISLFFGFAEWKYNLIKIAFESKWYNEVAF